ncbi:MAG: tyrosine-type recombinase/integrase [Deltaproteobacteria bacterium]|nr:tyrosine-type recombinase/integrase [Deltaproteobacteria bacterium]
MQAGSITTLIRDPSRPTSQNPALVYLARLGSDGSRRTQKQALERIVGLLTRDEGDILAMPWASLRYEHTQAIRAGLCREVSPRTGNPLSPAYINKTLAALRGVLKEAWRLGLMSAEDMQRASDIDAVRGAALPAGRALTIGEKQALSGVCQADPSPGGPRDAAIFVLGMAAGLRRAEMVGLDLDDYDTETGEVRVRRGKGRKGRVTHISPGCRAALADWLGLRGDAPGPLLCPVNRGQRITNRRMSDHAILLVCRKRSTQAGIPPFSPHDMRRTFIGDLLDAGADISVAQQLAGHASVTTTQRYDRRPEAKKREAAGLLHFPYVARGCSRKENGRETCPSNTSSP